MKSICAMLAAAAVGGIALEARAQLVNGIEGLVHDSVVTLQEVQVMTEPATKALARQYGNTPDLDKKLAQVQRDSLEQLMERQLILHEFHTAGYSLPESVIDDIVQESIRAKFGDRRSLTKSLEVEGITYEKFRERVRDRFIIDQMRLKNISSEITISPHKIDTYYQAHLDDFKVEDEVKLRMIVLNKSTEPSAPSPRALAEDILAKIKEGASFQEMAKVNSQDSKHANGGDWDWVQKSFLRKELADVAFGLKSGERSGVIETPDGACYLMQVEDQRPAHFKPIADVRDQIEKNLILEERSRLEKQWIEKLKKKTFVRYF